MGGLRMTTESIYNFWSLLEDYEIKIPIVQRDYAQGRKNAVVEEIRSNFLHDIFESINDDKELNLDFIYGSTKLNKVSNRKTFLPLDGQQRLTTLFLLHWYIGWKEGVIHKNKDIREKLAGFKYETRISSEEFCYTLVHQNSLYYDGSIEKISDVIKNEAWFFSSWIKDPTINSMLTMLDSIHDIFKDSTNFSEKLFGDGTSTKFKFIELEKFGLDDSLYIKMNARGKLLTPFENFKANIEKRIIELVRQNKIEDEHARQITSKFDTTWADLFWGYRDLKTNIYDVQFLNLLQTLISYHAFTISNQLPDLSLGVVKQDYFLQKDYIKYIDESFITRMERILDFFSSNLSDNNNYLESTSILQDNSLFIDVINNTKNMNFSQHVKFYGYCLFIIMNNDIDKVKVEFQNWIRIVSNLAENQIYNRPAEVYSSIKSLFRLSKYSRYILSHLADYNNEITGFFKTSIEEERLKAQFILKSNDWKKAILEAENHLYFRGQIMFLFRFGNVDEISRGKSVESWTQAELANKLVDFNLYYSKLAKIFAPDKLLVNENLWRRALLTKGNYLLNQRRNLSFVINTFDRDISWKRLLISEKNIYIKELIDDLNFVDIDKELENVIDKYIQGSNKDDWYYAFIKHPELINPKICGTNLFVRYLDDDSIYLLMTSTTSGRIREYYTSVLFLEIKDMLYSKDIKISCPPTPGISNPHYLKLSGNGKTVFIEYQGGWFYKYNEEDQGIKVSKEDLMDLLESENFIKSVKRTALATSSD